MDGYEEDEVTNEDFDDFDPNYQPPWWSFPYLLLPLLGICVFVTLFKSVPWYVSLTAFLLCLVPASLFHWNFMPAVREEYRLRRSNAIGDEDYAPSARAARRLSFWSSAIWVVAVPVWVSVYLFAEVPVRSFIIMGISSAIGFALPFAFRFHMRRERAKEASEATGFPRDAGYQS